MSFPEDSPYYVPPMAQNVLDFVAHVEAREARAQLGLEHEIETELGLLEAPFPQEVPLQSPHKSRPLNLVPSP